MRSKRFYPEALDFLSTNVRHKAGNLISTTGNAIPTRVVYCYIEPCNDHGKKYYERRDLQRHIQEMHPGCSDAERWLDEGKRFPDAIVQE